MVNDLSLIRNQSIEMLDDDVDKINEEVFFFFYFSHASIYLFSSLWMRVCRSIVSGMCIWCKRRVNQKLSTYKKKAKYIAS